MSVQALSVLWQARTGTEHYNWVKAISDALDTLGVGLTTDTGQISLAGTTLTLPSGSVSGNTVTQTGYQIRKLIRSGLPDVWLRIYYGAFQTTTDTTRVNSRPYLAITIGAGSDGAGNLSAPTVALTNAPKNTQQSSQTSFTTPIPIYLSSDGQTYLTVAINPAVLQTSSLGTFIFERTLDVTTGNPTSDGCISIGPSNSSCYTSIDFVLGNLNIHGTNASAKTVAGFTSSGTGTVAYLAPIAVALPRPMGDAKAALGFYSNDIGAGTSIVVNLYGSNHTYLTALGQTSNVAWMDTAASMLAAIRYE